MLTAGECVMDLEEAKAELFQHLRLEIKDKRVLQAMERVPREFFVPYSSRHLAYEDTPLPIGMEQTISQPLIVGIMTEALELGGRERVLEVGTGSGYQAAILAELAKWVVTVERYQSLVDSARRLLTELGYANIEVHSAEETLGWVKGSPYDAIIVTAGAPQVPIELLWQLNYRGHLVIPVGSRYEQELLKVTRKRDEFITKDLGPCRFVPLIGKGAWEDVR